MFEIWMDNSFNFPILNYIRVKWLRITILQENNLQVLTSSMNLIKWFDESHGPSARGCTASGSTSSSSSGYHFENFKKFSKTFDKKTNVFLIILVILGIGSKSNRVSSLYIKSDITHQTEEYFNVLLLCKSIVTYFK